jgi:Na+/melibiose symporter-like transporter
VPIGILAAVLAVVRLPESYGPRAGLDVRGLLLVSAGVLGIVWALVRGNDAGWASAEVVSSIALGAMLLAGFVLCELRVTDPMLPMRLFRSRAFSAGNLAIFCTFGALFAAVFFFAQFLQSGLGYGPLAAGIRLLPWTATFITLAPVAGALADRIGERPLMTAGLLLQALGLGWVALIAEPGLAYPHLLAPRSPAWNASRLT